MFILGSRNIATRKHDKGENWGRGNWGQVDYAP